MSGAELMSHTKATAEKAGCLQNAVSKPVNGKLKGNVR